MKKIILTALILITLLSLTAISAADNDTLISPDANTSTLNNDNVNLDKRIEVSGNTFDDIQKTVNESEANSTIILNGNYIGCGKEITVNKALTIEGKDSTILDAKSASGIFNINNGNVILKNLRFINGKSPDGGAIVERESDFLTIINCTFINNTAFYGGAIYSSNAYLSITNSIFDKNSAGDYGGAICSWRGDAINCTFIDNGALENGCGGAIDGLSNIINCTFINNHVFGEMGYGGAIDGYYYNPSISNCYFANNSATLGGAVYSVSDSNITNCTFANNYAESEGGAVYLTTSIYADEYVYIDDSMNSTILNCDFNNNYAGNEGGAIYSNANMNIINSSFTSNHADYAGAVILYSGEDRIDNCSFINNTYGSILFTFDKTSYNRLSEHGHVDRSHDFGELTIKNTTYTKSISLNDDLKTTYLVKSTVKTSINYGDSIKITLINKFTSKPLKGIEFIIKIGSKKYYVTTNSKGIAYFKNSLKADNHKITVIPQKYKGYIAMKQSDITIKVKKVNTNVKAPKITAKYKKSKYFKIYVKNKVTKKAAKKLKIKAKIYTGKKYKTVTLKTDNKGQAKLNTKSLKIGKHKVIISSGNANYKVSAKSLITIKR